MTDNILLKQAEAERADAWSEYTHMINSDTVYPLDAYRQALARWEQAEARVTVLKATSPPVPETWCLRCFRDYIDPEDDTGPADECRTCGALVAPRILG